LCSLAKKPFSGKGAHASRGKTLATTRAKDGTADSTVYLSVRFPSIGRGGGPL